jgi:hypothetical protein
MKIKTLFAVGVSCLGSLWSIPMMAQQVTNVDIPLNVVIPANACTGQAIAFEGNSHAVINVTINNNSIHFQSHYNMHGVTGVGLTNGAKYLLVEAGGDTMNINGATPIEATINTDVGLIGAGQAPNMRLRIVSHITIDATGKVTAEFLKSSIVCQQ